MTICVDQTITLKSYDDLRRLRPVVQTKNTGGIDVDNQRHIYGTTTLQLKWPIWRVCPYMKRFSSLMVGVQMASGQTPTGPGEGILLHGSGNDIEWTSATLVCSKSQRFVPKSVKIKKRHSTDIAYKLSFVLKKNLNIHAEKGTAWTEATSFTSCSVWLHIMPTMAQDMPDETVIRSTQT